VGRDHVVGIVGSSISNIALAASEVAAPGGVALVTHSFADRTVERGYRNIFQMLPKVPLLAAATLDHTRKERSEQ
jgi:ABC-type branched-subunit amino acid transport system substrate-binding protein